MTTARDDRQAVPGIGHPESSLRRPALQANLHLPACSAPAKRLPRPASTVKLVTGTSLACVDA